MSSDFKTHSQSLRGRLLLASPALRDEFRRTVLIVNMHTPDDGAVGMVLNRPTGKVVGDLLHGEEFEPLKKIPVLAGGPVMCDQLTFSALWWTPKRGLNWAMRISTEEAFQQSCRPGRMVCAFLGYTGWSPGQLESEMVRDAWFVSDATKEMLGFGRDESMWRTLLGRISPMHRILAEAPDDPFLN